ncbi:MAG: hypothetical protein WCI05_08295, partial [Myxococcales bacterium]
MGRHPSTLPPGSPKPARSKLVILGTDLSELNQTHLENRRFRAADLTPPAPLSLDIVLAHAGKDDRLRARGEESL